VKHFLMRFGWYLLAAVGLVACAAAVLTVAGQFDSETEGPKCTRKPGQGVTGERLDKTVKLVPDTPGEVVNFGGSEEREFVDVVLNATPALPSELRANELRLEVLRRFTRGSTTLRREAAPVPTFTNPRISRSRDRVTFTICLSGDDLAAGTYTGSVSVEGPPGLSPASISITENAKNSALALIGGGGAILAAFVFLVLRGAASRQITEKESHVEEIEKIAAAVPEQADAHAKVEQLVRAKPPPKRHVTAYLGDVFKDLNWWVTTLVALGLATGTIIAIYQANPSWGADTWGSIAALVGPVFSAVGVQSVVTSLGRSVGQDTRKNEAESRG
jgi:hypothetical protein